MKKIIFALLILSSCTTTTIKEFSLNNDEYLKLYKNNTFEKETRLLERKFIQKGKWEGGFAEGQTLKLILNNDNIGLTNSLPYYTYTIENGLAIEKNDE